MISDLSLSFTLGGGAGGSKFKPGRGYLKSQDT